MLKPLPIIAYKNHEIYHGFEDAALNVRLMALQSLPLTAYN